jgi:hypothetical protein
MIGMKRKKSSNKKPHIELPDPFIIMNHKCHVWIGLAEGGRKAVFSDRLELAKELHYDSQFKVVQGLVYENLEKMYL